MTSDISDDNRFKKSLINIHYKINMNYKSWAIKSLTMRVEIVKTGKKRFWRKFVSASMSDDVGERSGLQGLKNPNALSREETSTGPKVIIITLPAA